MKKGSKLHVVFGDKSCLFLLDGVKLYIKGILRGMERTQKVIKIGIIGTGRITGRFVSEAKTIDGIELAGVYNPRLSSAQKFANTYGIEHICQNVEELFSCSDAVYVASPHNSHVSYTKAALETGKHVLCEKPMAFSEKDARMLMDLAKSNHVVLMEAIKTAYCPGFHGLLEVINSGKIGKVVDVEACFTKLTQSNLREFWDEQYGGSFIELGTYTLLPILKILGMYPKKVSYWCRNTLLGSDAYTKVMYDYGTATATAKTGLGAKSEGQLIVTGTKGYIVVPAPWWLTKTIEVHYEDPNKTEYYTYPYEGAGLRYEIRAFVDSIGSFDSMCLEVSKRNKQFQKDSPKYIAKISVEESIWLAKQMELFLDYRFGHLQNGTKDVKNQKIRNNCMENFPNIWAHRGCSMAFPENTLEAFEAAAKLDGITGIELDVQLTLDGEIVVIHDETVDRTTSGSGDVKDYTLAELKELEIKSVNNTITCIPTLREVFTLLKPYCEKNGLYINIELKNSKVRYQGMEEKTIALVKEFGLEDVIIYSSFLTESVGLVKKLNPKAKTGTLSGSMEQCLKDAIEQNADALHPWVGGMDLLEAEYYNGYPIRVWNGEEPFFGEDRELKEMHMTKYARLGATDVITNVPERYL